MAPPVAQGLPKIYCYLLTLDLKMEIIPEEKRSHARLKSSLKVDISDKVLGDTVDLSEGGLSFNSTETIASPVVFLQIHFSDKEFEFKTKAKLVWNRDLAGGSSSYGVEFVNLSETQKAVLRKELITMQIKELLDDITMPGIKQQISDFFLKNVLNYADEIAEFNLCLSEEYSEGLEKKIDRINTLILLRGCCLEELLSEKEIMQKVKDNFRKLMRAWIYKSAIMKRAYEKPLGYAGDYKMLEIIFDNNPISKNIGVYFDTYFLKSPFAAAARIRKNYFNELLQNYINETALNEIAILSFACGSCREIRELLPNLKAKGTVAFTCLDGNAEALNFSQEALSRIPHKNVEFNFIEEDKAHIVENQSLLQPLGRQNLIYSIDLFDYLPDSDFKKILYSLYELLQKDGKLIFSHINREKTFPPVPLDWLCDWKFIPRNKGEVIKLFHACGISGFLLSVDSDDFEYIYYFTLTKYK